MTTKTTPLVRFTTGHLLSHGQGPLRQWSLKFRNHWELRLSWGGYGYNKIPGHGCFAALPKITIPYRSNIYRLSFLAGNIQLFRGNF